MANNGSAMPAVYQTLDVSAPVAGTPDTNELDKLLISSFGAVDMTNMRISCLIHMLFSRIGDDPADDHASQARFWEFYLHYQTDGRGSAGEFSKS